MSKIIKDVDSRDTLTVEENKDEKTFDEIMNEILGEDNENVKTDREEFEEMIKDVSIPFDNIYPLSCLEEIENRQIYKFSDDARIGLFNGDIFDTGFGEGYREITQIQTSNCLEITGHFNTRDLKIEKHPDKYRFGQVKFIDKQKCDSLVVEKVGLFGNFDASLVSINDSSFVDINLDISNKSKCTYLLIDTRFDRVRGKINMSKDYYNQLNVVNIDYLVEVNKSKMLEILVDDKPIEKYLRYKSSDDSLSSKYSKIREMLNEIYVEL